MVHEHCTTKCKSQSLSESREWIMTGDLDAKSQQALVEVNKKFTDQEQREDAATKMDMRNHPFDWWDLLLVVMPIAAIVVAMFSEAE
jgi:hypothetical protein